MNKIEKVKDLLMEDLTTKETFDFVVLVRNPKTDFLSYSISLIDAYVKIKIYKMYPEDTRFLPRMFSEIDAIFMDCIMGYTKEIEHKIHKLFNMIDEYNESYDIQYKNTLSQKIQTTSMKTSKEIATVYSEHKEVINHKLESQITDWFQKFHTYTTNDETTEWKDFIDTIKSFFQETKESDTQ